ncbi:FRG domain-containing protein [Vibrio brasiliensis]|uniref:FRG domain-containing protein n=1 Tax=Vibrio brasiliensis TaxID=170652 RepID=UPI001EFC416C|nr:FRG domain-containing protein [Vibrio brasiliensis]MCG9650845.1 FRG domain-containing protein [Vibrio brasiliensis]
MSIEKLFEELQNSSEELQSDTIWYRGHSESSFKLLPTAYRSQESFNELALFYDYKSHVASINGANKDDWDIILDMQHYGLPTRLLDWTSSVGTALYFALRSNPTNPCIWIIDPFELSRRSTSEATIFDTSVIVPSNPTANKNLDLFNIMSGQSAYELPFSIQPPHGNRRISAQRGMFTVHTGDTRSIEEQVPEILRKVEIPVESIDLLQSYLSLMGVDDYSMFPDHYGLSEFLKKKYELIK